MDGDQFDSGPEGVPDPRRGFRYASERQRSLHRRLAHVSRSCAAAYLDACRILNGDAGIRSRTLLVAHLGREIESGIRTAVTGKGRVNHACNLSAALDALGIRRGDAVRDEIKMAIDAAVGERPSEEGEDGGHVRSIDETLDALEFQANHPVRDEWKQIRGFAKWAHRQSLLGPRGADAEFTEWWQRVEAVFDTVLQRFERKFENPLKRAEQLAALETPTKKDVQRLQQTLPRQPVVLGHFFDSLQSPAWLELLWRHGELRPPDNEEDSPDGIAFTFVPQASYLARMAKVDSAQSLVADVLRDIRATRHLYADGELLAAVVALPAELQAALVPQVLLWLDGGLVVFEPSRLVSLVDSLSRGGEASAALALFGGLLEPYKDTRESILGPTAVGRFDSFEYWRIVDQTSARVAEAGGVAAVALTCDLLERAVEIELGESRYEGRYDGSWTWCPYVGHPRHDHGVRNHLVGAVRDIAECVARRSASDLHAVVEVLRSRRFFVFDRLAMHLLADAEDAVLSDVEVFLCQPACWTQAPITDEFRRLCRAKFPTLNVDARRSIIDAIYGGPSIADWRKRFESRNERVPTAEDEQAFVGSWQRDRLSLISNSLDAEDKERFDQLVAAHGEPEEDDPPSHGFSVGNGGSPLSKQQLEELENDALLRFLMDWQATGAWNEPSREGLAGVLQSAVEEQPDRFSGLAPRFSSVHADYITALLAGLERAVKHASVSCWPQVLKLGQWIMHEHPSLDLGALFSSEGADSDASAALARVEADVAWGSARRRLADLLEAALRIGPGRIPIEHRDVVWRLIEALAVDADPFAPADEVDTEDDGLGPINVAINSVRGMALHCVFQYVNWVQKLAHPDLGAPGDKAVLSVVPEARKLLEERLAAETSPAIRAVFAQYLTWMVTLDRGWVRTALPAIFPAAPALRTRWETAWITYIATSALYGPVFRLLRPEYLRATARRDARGNPASDEAAKGLAEHMLLLVRWGIAHRGDEDRLLEAFHESVPDAVRAHGVGREGQDLGDAEVTISAEILARLEAYWEERIRTAENGAAAAMRDELSAFGWWFSSGKLPGARSLELFQRGLQIHPRADNEIGVAQQLARLSSASAARAIACVHVLVEGDEKGWLVTHTRDHIKDTLAGARSTGRQDAKDAADALVGLLLSRGYLEFRGL